MSDAFYNLVYCIGWMPIHSSSRFTVLHGERLKRGGAYILAANHLSPYDVPCLMAASPRALDFVSIAELFKIPFVRWLFTRMGAMPLDRGRRDSPTVREILHRLQRGRVVTMFPESGIREPERSILIGGPFKPGVARLAHLANCPILPVVIIGPDAYRQVAAWMPLKRTRVAVHVGEAIEPNTDPKAMEERLRQSYPALYRDLLAHLARRGIDVPGHPIA